MEYNRQKYVFQKGIGMEKSCFSSLRKQQDAITHIMTDRVRVVSNAILRREKFDGNTDKAVRYNFDE